MVGELVTKVKTTWSLTRRLHIGTSYWKLIQPHSYRLLARTLVCLTDKWVTLRWATWTSVLAVSFTKIWWRSTSLAVRIRSWRTRRSNVLIATQKRIISRSTSWAWFPMVVYIALWSIFWSWRISPRNTESARLMFIVSWMVVIRTRRVVKVLSKRWRIIWRLPAVRSLLSSDVITLWTVTNVGNAWKRLTTYWLKVRVSKPSAW